MWQIGVWEKDEGLAEQVAAVGESQPALVRCGRHPAQLTGRAFDLLVVSPQATGWAGAPALNCQIALVPGTLASLTRYLPAQLAVSYGMGPANTLTLSSLEEDQASVAVQREFTALNGTAVERQELVLPYDGSAPDLFLARAGTWLLVCGKAQ